LLLSFDAELRASSALRTCSIATFLQDTYPGGFDRLGNNPLSFYLTINSLSFVQRELGSREGSSMVLVKSVGVLAIYIVT
jgi:hypothetical protein